jgi:hypothetical protein
MLVSHKHIPPPPQLDSFSECDKYMNPETQHLIIP